MFTDSDCVADSDWIENLVQPFDRPDIGAAAGGVVGLGKETVLDKFHALFTLQMLPENQLYSEFTLGSGGFPTANLAVRKSVFEQICGFDEHMKIYSEDHDLCARIYKDGYRIQYIREALIYHRHRNTFSGTWRQSFGFGTGHAALLKKHFDHCILLDLPKLRLASWMFPARIWVDLAGADKKVGFLVLLACFWWPLAGGLILYLTFLYRDIGSRLSRKNIESAAHERIKIVFLLIYKSLALTAGRIKGSLNNRVLCL